MNRKEMIVVGVIMLISFVGGAFGVPAVQQVFVTNFPSNEQVTVTNFPQPTSPTLQTTGVDIGLVADRKSTRLNSSHLVISYAVFCLKKKKKCDYTFTLV